MNIGIDLHDTISYRPILFKQLIDGWINTNYVIIITGTPTSNKQHVIDLLTKHQIRYHDIALGFNYNKQNMDITHFVKMRDWKLSLCKEYMIDLYIDDNPYYVKYIADYGICTLQPILSSMYINEWSKKDPFFTCHLQKLQFDFLFEQNLQRKE